MDPFATALAPVDNWEFAEACGYDPGAPESDVSFSTVDNAAVTPKCVFTDE